MMARPRSQFVPARLRSFTQQPFGGLPAEGLFVHARVMAPSRASRLTIPKVLAWSDMA